MKYAHPMSISVLAAFLQTGRMLDHAGSLALLLSWLLLLQVGVSSAFIGWIGFGLSVLALLEKYYAWRVALDANLFDCLAQNRSRDLAQFDAAMAAFLRPGREVSPERTMESRFMGARRLFLRQVALVLLQMLGLILVWLFCFDKLP